MEQSRKKEREKKRKALLELQYADMVSNLVLLLGAGMTVSKAWNRLTENYMNERQKRTICRKEVYEEMQRTSFEIKNGMGEERAYERFGERCGGYRYRKFGNLLAQNLRKGSRGSDKAVRAGGGKMPLKNEKVWRESWGRKPGQRCCFR